MKAGAIGDDDFRSCWAGRTRSWAPLLPFVLGAPLRLSVIVPCPMQGGSSEGYSALCSGSRLAGDGPRGVFSSSRGPLSRMLAEADETFVGERLVVMMGRVAPKIGGLIDGASCRYRCPARRIFLPTVASPAWPTVHRLSDRKGLQRETHDYRWIGARVTANVRAKPSRNCMTKVELVLKTMGIILSGCFCHRSWNDALSGGSCLVKCSSAISSMT